MAKMWFTFKWGNGSLVSKDYLEQQLSLYYTKQEIDNFLKQYVTKIDLAGELADYLTNATYEEFRTQNAKDLQELGNNVNKNSRDITTIEEQLRGAKFVYIPNDNLNWNSADTYKVGALVSYNNQLFLSLQNNNLNKNPETENTYWVKFDTGNVEIDLSNYYTKQDIDNLLNNYVINNGGSADLLDVRVTYLNVNGVLINQQNNDLHILKRIFIDDETNGGYVLTEKNYSVKPNEMTFDKSKIVWRSTKTANSYYQWVVTLPFETKNINVGVNNMCIDWKNPTSWNNINFIYRIDFVRDSDASTTGNLIFHFSGTSEGDYNAFFDNIATLKWWD